MGVKVGFGVGVGLCVGVAATVLLLIGVLAGRWEEAIFQNAALASVIEPSIAIVALSTIKIIVRCLPTL